MEEKTEEKVLFVSFKHRMLVNKGVISRGTGQAGMMQLFDEGDIFFDDIKEVTEDVIYMIKGTIAAQAQGIYKQSKQGGEIVDIRVSILFWAFVKKSQQQAPPLTLERGSVN